MRAGREGIRFVHTADWQLGMTRHYLQGEAQARFTQDRIDAIRRIGELAGAEDCAFVLVCGDVFEHSQVEPRTVKRALEAMAAIDRPVWLLPGNHDPLDAASVYRAPTFAAACPDNVRVLDRSGLVEIEGGVELLAVPWPSKRPGRDLVAAALRELEPARGLRIGVAHGRVDRLAPDRDEPALIALAEVEAALGDGRLHYLALGDRHSATEVAPRVWYAGAPEATDFGEVRPGQALVVALDAQRCEVAPHRIGGWQFVQHERAVAGDADLERLAATLAEQTAKERTVLRLALSGTLPLAQRARLDSVLDDARQRFAALDVRNDIATAPDDGDFADLALGGFARSALDELRAAAPGDAEAADALALLYRLCLAEGDGR
jgi:DNA repair exonuclease SbcCD nuclease subunit